LRCYLLSLYSCAVSCDGSPLEVIKRYIPTAAPKSIKKSIVLTGKKTDSLDPPLKGAGLRIVFVQRYGYSGDKAGRIFSCRVIFFQPIAEHRILTELTYIWMNFSGDVLSAIASLLAISFPIVRLPVSIPEMCCRGTPPTLAPSASWVNPAFSR